ncbi:LacI family DNA-binding transcriptional regulator [Microbacterium sp. NPDC058389]|uniref:LacI family DNA-binding transcriptional regulator n=1 Tax=Microbacterium sp. NPDC058389 TaxID=3346475 RepID=UPI003655ADB5
MTAADAVEPLDSTVNQSPPTLKDVAAAAGVGLGTVSRVLSGNGRVADATRTRVEEVVRELGYRPSALGRGLKRQRTDTIGLLVADIANPFYGEFAKGVLDAAKAAGRHVIVGSSGEDPTAEREYVDLLLEQRVDGIIAFPTGGNVQTWRAARDRGVSVVFADRLLAGFDAPAVVIDNDEAAFRLTVHLFKQGHSRIGYLGGPVALSSGRLREEGFRRAHQVTGMPLSEDLIIRQEFTRDSAHGSALSLVDRPDRPTAVIASNNVLGEAALAAIGTLGLRMPQDISLAMIDDVPWAWLTHPSITVISQPTRALGAEAIRLISEGIDTGVSVLPTELLIRESTGRL